jgi:hypothetical protein
MNGVAGVVAALRAYDDIRLFRQDVDDFAFAFVAPLSADKNRICHSIKIKTPKEYSGQSTWAFARRQ